LVFNGIHTHDRNHERIHGDHDDHGGHICERNHGRNHDRNRDRNHDRNHGGRNRGGDRGNHGVRHVCGCCGTRRLGVRSCMMGMRDHGVHGVSMRDHGVRGVRMRVHGVCDVRMRDHGVRGGILRSVLLVQHQPHACRCGGRIRNHVRGVHGVHGDRSRIHGRIHDHTRGCTNRGRIRNHVHGVHGAHGMRRRHRPRGRTKPTKCSWLGI